MLSSPPLVLFVCSANICRSPLAQATFHNNAPDLVGEGMLRLSSAGVDAHPGSPRCEWSAARTGDAFDDDGARSVELSELDDATVVLAADRGVVSALIRRSPSVRGRTFTMKEASRLGQLVLADPRHTVSELPELVLEMDARRGWLPMESDSARRFRRQRRSWSTVLDVPDAHSQALQTRHTVMFTELDGAISLFADVVCAVYPTD